MGKKFNLLAAKLRILQRAVEASTEPLPLQSRAVELHRFHCELLHRNVHFGSLAVDQCVAESLVTRPHARWAKALHRNVACERHNVYDTFALPTSAIQCADLEAKLLCAACRSATKWNPSAPVFVPFEGPAHLLAGSCGEPAAQAESDLDSVGTTDLHLFAPAQHIDIVDAGHSRQSDPLASDAMPAAPVDLGPYLPSIPLHFDQYKLAHAQVRGRSANMITDNAAIGACEKQQPAVRDERDQRALEPLADMQCEAASDSGVVAVVKRWRQCALQPLAICACEKEQPAERDGRHERAFELLAGTQCEAACYGGVDSTDKQQPAERGERDLRELEPLADMQCEAASDDGVTAVVKRWRQCAFQPQAISACEKEQPAESYEHAIELLTGTHCEAACDGGIDSTVESTDTTDRVGGYDAHCTRAFNDRAHRLIWGYRPV